MFINNKKHANNQENYTSLNANIVDNNQKALNLSSKTNASGNTTSHINSIKILGSGCSECTLLANNAAEAVKILGLTIPIEHVKDNMQIASYGVMSTPALVFNNKVLSFGKVISSQDIVNLLKPLI